MADTAFLLKKKPTEIRKSLKREWSTNNFFTNLFALFNKRYFNTGKWRGYSPVERAKILHS
jgi:hypothetical protein